MQAAGTLWARSLSRWVNFGCGFWSSRRAVSWVATVINDSLITEQILIKLKIKVGYKLKFHCTLRHATQKRERIRHTCTNIYQLYRYLDSSQSDIHSGSNANSVWLNMENG